MHKGKYTFISFGKRVNKKGIEDINSHLTTPKKSGTIINLKITCLICEIVTIIICIIRINKKNKQNLNKTRQENKIKKQNNSHKNYSLEHNNNNNKKHFINS